jgi:hypothetical protein
VADRSPESVWVTVTGCYGDNGSAVVCEPTATIYGLCGGVQVAQDAMQSLKASRSRKHGGNSGNNPRYNGGIRAAATFNCESESFTAVR